ncbi:MAG: coenzyme F420-0:L-glutamate ligase [Chloroflexi bacterium]|nr:coenzyme F420-0:L-glutamate ligase [Chloroflexota bacterium]
MSAPLTIWALDGMPEVQPGDDLPALIRAGFAIGPAPRAGDIVVVTHKIVSKAEGQLVDLATVAPSPRAVDFAATWGKDARQIEVVLREAARIVRMERGVIIAETRHGFVCANAGVDASNVPGADTVCLLPADPDASAAALHVALSAALGIHLPVIISDSFGRPWRLGITNIAIGVAGLQPLTDYRGQTDPYGYLMAASVLATADELAAAAELVMGKVDKRPVAVIRGYPYAAGPGVGHDLIMDSSRDLFR